jgi:hypothetical protein
MLTPQTVSGRPTKQHSPSYSAPQDGNNSEGLVGFEVFTAVNVGFEVFEAVTMKNDAFRDISSFTLFILP